MMYRPMVAILFFLFLSPSSPNPRLRGVSEPTKLQPLPQQKGQPPPAPRPLEPAEKLMKSFKDIEASHEEFSGSIRDNFGWRADMKAPSGSLSW